MSSPAPTTVCLQTFGCQMNVLDSQLVSSRLRSLGYRFVDDWRAADVVLYNTCSVRQAAEQKVFSRLGLARLQKRQRPDLVVGVLGCMAEQGGRKLFGRYPQIDFLCGPGQLDRIPALIEAARRAHLKGEKRSTTERAALAGNTHRRSQTLAAAQDRLELLDLARSFAPDEHRGAAYVRITRGCNKMCTYCVVPFTRGTEIHRPPQSIIDECKKLADAGVLEITLIGQTVNHYHFDHSAATTLDGVVQPQIGAVMTGQVGGNRARDITSFAQLLARIHEAVPHLPRLRFVTSFPRDFGDDILDVMAACPRICRYFHLPVQSGSDRLLALMNRGYSAGEYLDLVGRIRQKLPGAELATDIICGFPTETPEDHQATIRLLESARCKNAFIFKYSPRPGTAAAKRFPDDIPEATKRARNNELLAVQSAISQEIHQQYVGRTLRVFVESVSEHTRRSKIAGQALVQLTGRTDGDLIVCFDGPPALVGRIVEVRIDRAAALTLFGTITNNLTASVQQTGQAPAGFCH